MSSRRHVPTDTPAQNAGRLTKILQAGQNISGPTTNDQRNADHVMTLRVDTSEVSDLDIITFQATRHVPDAPDVHDNYHVRVISGLPDGLEFEFSVKKRSMGNDPFYYDLMTPRDGSVRLGHRLGPLLHHITERVVDTFFDSGWPLPRMSLGRYGSEFTDDLREINSAYIHYEDYMSLIKIY